MTSPKAKQSTSPPEIAKALALPPPIYSKLARRVSLAHTGEEGQQATTGLARGAAGNDVPLPKADAESPSLPSPTSRRSSTLRKHSSKREKRGLSHSNSHGDHAANDFAARSSSESCGSGSESDNGNYDVDRAIRLARKRASMRLRAENSRLALRASTHSLMAKLAGGVDLDGNDQITPQMMREQVQGERAREAVRDFLISKRLMDPPFARGPTAAGSSSSYSLCTHHSSTTTTITGGGGGLPSMRHLRISAPNADLPSVLTSPVRNRPQATSPTSMPYLPSALSSGGGGATSAPCSPMATAVAAATARRRQLMEGPTQAGSGRSTTSGIIPSTADGNAQPGSPGATSFTQRFGSGAVGGTASRRTTFLGLLGGGDDGGGGTVGGALPRIAGVEALDSGSDGEKSVDLEVVARNEKRRLAKVQSKVGDMLKSQQRYQGLLANRGGREVGALAARSASCGQVLTAEELTASIMPAPAKPPDGVELKVPVDDIRFSGIRLRFLMGLLEAIEAHPLLCRSTLDLVQHFVIPVTQDQRCRLLDLIPSELRGQPHHYICHAWSCSSQELLSTLKREMLPPAPPRPPPLSMQRGGGGAAAGGPGANGKGRLAAAGGLHGVRRVGGGAGAGPGGGAAGGKVAGGLAPGTHLPSLNGGAVKGEGGGAGAAAGDGTNALYASIAGSQEAVWRHYEEMMAKYKEELEKALDQVVWVDFVCNNQHTMAKKDYGKVAKKVVECGATVVVLDSDLTPLSRTWCLLEIMHCIRCKRHLKVFRVESSDPTSSGEDPDKMWDRVVETISMADSKATLEQDRVGILQEVLNTVGMQYVNDTIKKAMRLSNSERARQLALRREQLKITMELLQPDPAIVGTEEYEANLAKCREHLQAVLHEFYPEDMLRCIIPHDYVSNSARCWDMLCIFAEILDRELFREDAKALRGMAWLIFKRHSKQYIEVLYEKELDNWLVNSLEHDRKWRRVQAKLKHDSQKKWS